MVPLIVRAPEPSIDNVRPVPDTFDKKKLPPNVVVPALLTVRFRVGVEFVTVPLKVRLFVPLIVMSAPIVVVLEIRRVPPPAMSVEAALIANAPVPKAVL